MLLEIVNRKTVFLSMNLIIFYLAHLESTEFSAFENRRHREPKLKKRKRDNISEDRIDHHFSISRDIFFFFLLNRAHKMRQYILIEVFLNQRMIEALIIICGINVLSAYCHLYITM